MSITSIDGVLAGLQKASHFAKALTGTLVAGRPMSLFYLAGYPGAATVPTSPMSGNHLTSYAGQIPFTNPQTGNTYLARFSGQSTQPGVLLLCDRLWHNSGMSGATLTSTSEFAVSGTTILPRDENGLDNGHGVYAGIEVYSATGAGTPTVTLKYMNESGVSARTSTNIVNTVASSIAGTFYPMGLDSGDLGIKRVNTIKLSATWTSGSIGIVLYRVIAQLPLTAANVANAIDAITGGFPRMYDNTVPFLLFIPNTTTTSNISGTVQYAQG